MSGRGVEESPLGPARQGKDSVYRVRQHGELMLWIPEEAKRLQVRLMTCAHMREAGHRGAAATLERLKPYCAWPGMEGNVKEFVRLCLHCADSKTGSIIPQPFEVTRHGTKVSEVVHFDYLQLGRTC